MRTATVLAFVLVLGSVLGTCRAQGDHLYTVTSFDGFLRRVDPLTGNTSLAVQMVTGAGISIDLCNGLARHPLTDQLYAIVRDANTPSIRRLATVDPSSGVATVIGALNDNFAGITFRSDGILFGVTGDGGMVPETLFTINLANAQSTFVMALGAGGPGESITFGADGFLYHFSGCCTLNVDTILERINTATASVTPIPLSGFPYFEILGATPWVGGNLLLSDFNDNVLVITTGGVSSAIAVFDHIAIKGLAFVPSPPTQAFKRPYGAGCAASSGRIPLLTMTGTPSPAMIVQLNLLLAPGSSPGVLAIGSGTGTQAFPSAACQVQILPLFPDLLPFTTTPAGTWSPSFGVPPTMPVDLFAQTAIVNGAALVVSNPLLVHVQ